MHTFPQNLAQINIKSKPCHPVQKYETRTFFSLEKGLNKKFKEKVKSRHNRTPTFLQKTKPINPPSALVFYIPQNISHCPVETRYTDDTAEENSFLKHVTDKMLFAR